MKYLLLILSLCGSIKALAQKHKEAKEIFYLYDKEGVPVKHLGKAYTFTSVLQKNDTSYISRTYLNHGPLIMQQTFKDANLTVPHGRFAWYDKDGNIDSTGLAINGRKSGAWKYHTQTLGKYKGTTLTKDSVIKTVYYNLGKEINKEDYLKITRQNTLAKGRSFFKTGYPIMKEDFDKDAVGSSRPEYPGRQKGWLRYLERNINTNLGNLIATYKNLKHNVAPINLSFLIGKKGNIDDIFILKSSGYPFDKEAISVIKNSGKWVPAQQGGHAVTFRKSQKIIFAKPR